MQFLKNIHPFKINELDHFVKVMVGGKQIGLTPPDFAYTISNFNDVWQMTDNGLELNDEYCTFEERTKAVDDTFMALSDAGILPPLPDYSAFGGIDWLSVKPHEGADALFVVKRFYYSCLGIQVHAVIVNGFTDDEYWVAVRGKKVESGAGKLDVIVAGMIRHGESVVEAMYHESQEEACLSPEDLTDAREIALLHLPNLNRYGFLQDEWFHIFDINLKEKTPVVGLPIEVESFRKISIQELMTYLEDGVSIKEHIRLVITDYLIRHGHLNESHPGFQKIKELLYRENYALSNRP